MNCAMNKPISIFAVALTIFFTLALFSSYTGNETVDSIRTTAQKTNAVSGQLPQIIKAVDLNRPFSFAGEALPMENSDVLERLDHELLRNSYYHSHTILAIKRARRFFPIIESILAEEGVPDDMKFLAVAESNLANAVSPAGAKGVWQFMKGTGQDYKMEINSQVDERYHLEKATRAACKYLKSKKEKFGSWTLAAAAYNMGSSRLTKEMNLQRMSNFYDLNLNQETSKYVFRIVALKEILSRPQDFGFYIDEEEKYAPLKDYILLEVDGAIENIGDFAKKHNTSYRAIKQYNPWLVSSALTNKNRKKYILKIPKGKF